MMCFRDMTFCPFWRDCTAVGECSRPLTDEVVAAARRWWGKDGAPIAQFVEKPACHVARPGA